MNNSEFNLILKLQFSNMRYIKIIVSLLLVILNVSPSQSSDITNLVFGTYTDVLPAAFGDFNSDELTDVFVLRDNQEKIEILLAYEEEPLLRPSRPEPLVCSFTGHKITSVVPGDYDGDALMDVLLTTVRKQRHGDTDFDRSITYVFVLWGGVTSGSSYLNCSVESKPLIEMYGQPLAIDYNQDMIIDLFGQNTHKERMFWVFDKSRGKPKAIEMHSNRNPMAKLRVPHAHAFLGKYFLLCSSNYF